MATTSTNRTQPACSACGERLNESARFCHACGAAASDTSSLRSSGLPWGIAALAVIALAALLGGRVYGSRKADPARITIGGAQAPDISSMSPEEQAQRLLSRVIGYASDGREDSAAFFAPMAIEAFERLVPLDTHHRFDLGLVAFAIGDMARASAEADSIVAVEPANLLGLALAMQSADVGGDTVTRNTFARRLLDAETSELNRNLPEYQKHDAELRAAIEAARGHRP